MSEHCADHSNFCENMGMINEGIKGMAGSIERLLAQSGEHYTAEKELRQANEEQNIKLGVICKILETAEDEKKDREKEKRSRQWSIIMSVVGPAIGAILVFIFAKMGM